MQKIMRRDFVITYRYFGEDYNTVIRARYPGEARSTFRSLKRFRDCEFIKVIDRERI